MPSTTSTESKEGLDQTDMGVMNLWWGLIQDQLGTLSREIDSLRHSQTQLQARQTEALMQQADYDKVGENVARIAKMLEAEKQDRIDGCERIWETVKAEQSSHAVNQKEYQLSLSRLQASIHDEVSERQAAQKSLGDQLRQALISMKDDLREELDGQIVGFRHELVREADARANRDEDLAEYLRKLSASVESERESQGSCLAMLQSQLDILSNEFHIEREDWSQKRTTLQEKIIRSLGEQEELLSKERQARDAQQASLEAQVDVECRKMEADLKHILADTCNREREQTKALLGRTRQILESDEALRERLQNLLSSEMVSKADFTSETSRLWQALKTRHPVVQSGVVSAPARTGTSRAGSPVPTTTRTGSPVRRFVSNGSCFSPCTTVGESGFTSPLSSISTTQSIAVLPGAPSRQAGSRNARSVGQLGFVGSVTATSAVSSAPLSHR